MLQQFTVGDRTYGFAEGKCTFLIIDNDFVHYPEPTKNDAPIELTGGLDGNGQRIWVTTNLNEIRQRLEPMPSLPKWAHYWGIKDRVQDNYYLLLRSMREIGISTRDMPRWGA